MAQKRTSRKKQRNNKKKQGKKTVGGRNNFSNFQIYENNENEEERQPDLEDYLNIDYKEDDNPGDFAPRRNRTTTKDRLKNIGTGVSNFFKNKKKVPGKPKKKGKVGNFEKRFAETGELIDKIAYDLDFDSLKSSDKKPIIQQTLIEQITNNSNLLNDVNREIFKTEIGFKNANIADVIWKFAREVEENFALIRESASEKPKEKGSKTISVIETEIFPAQKEKIHTSLLKFLHDMFLEEEGEEGEEALVPPKIVWSFISEPNIKTLIDKSIPSGFKDVKEIKLSDAVGVPAAGSPSSASAGGGGRKRNRSFILPKKQKGGVLMLDGEGNVDNETFNHIENDTCFYSSVSADSLLVFLEDISKLGTIVNSVFFDLETIQEDWTESPDNVDMLFKIWKDVKMAILIADPELEFKGKKDEMVLRATFNLDSGTYGIFVHKSVDELTSVMNLLDGMELVERIEGEEKEIVKPTKIEEEKEEVLDPKNSKAEFERIQKEEAEKKRIQEEEAEKKRIQEEAEKKRIQEEAEEAEKKRIQEEEAKKQKAKEISDAILKTAIRLVADSLKEKELPIKNTSELHKNTHSNTLDMKFVPSERRLSLRSISEFIPVINEEQVLVLNKKDPNIVPEIETSRQEINITYNIVNNVKNIIHYFEEEKTEIKPEEIAELKTKNEEISKNLEELTTIVKDFMNSQIVHDINKDNIQRVNAIEMADSGTQTPSSSDDMKKEFEAFQKESKEKTAELENKVKELQEALKASNIQNKLTGKENTALLEENANLFGQLKELQEKKKVINAEAQTDDNNSNALIEINALTEKNLTKLQNEQKKVPPIKIEPSVNENQKQIVSFKISETGLRVGGLKKGSHLFKDNAVFLGWDYIKGIRNNYEKYKEPNMYKKIISPVIISERVTMCKNLLNILDNLTDIKKIEERKKHKKNVPEIYLEHVSIIAYILDYKNLQKLPIKTVTSKNNEIQKYKSFTEDNVLYYHYKKQVIPKNPIINIDDFKDTTNILDFFEKVRFYLFQELTKIDESLSTDTNYFETTEKAGKGKKNKSNTAKYENMLQEIHKIIQQKQRNLKDLEDKNDENVKLINKIPHNDQNKGGEKIDIHADTPDLDNYLNTKSLMKSGQMAPSVKESPKDVLKHNYETAIIPNPNNLKILNTIDTTIKLNNNDGIVDYQPIDFIDLIDITAETTVEIPIPKNKKNKTEKNKGKPNSNRQSRRSLDSDITSNTSQAESEKQENTETYIIKPIKEDVFDKVTSIIKILNKIYKEDVQNLLKNPSSVSEINSNSSGRLSENTGTGSFVTGSEGNVSRPFSGVSSDSAKTIQNAKNTISRDNSIVKPLTRTPLGSPTSSPISSAREN